MHIDSIKENCNFFLSFTQDLYYVWVVVFKKKLNVSKHLTFILFFSYIFNRFWFKVNVNSFGTCVCVYVTTHYLFFFFIINKEFVYAQANFNYVHSKMKLVFLSLLSALLLHIRKPSERSVFVVRCSLDVIGFHLFFSVTQKKMLYLQCGGSEKKNV